MRQARVTCWVLLERKGEEVSEFQLLPSFGACIHVPPPPPNQILHVVSAPAPNRFKCDDLKLERPRGFRRYVVEAKRKPPATISRRRRKSGMEADQFSA